MSESIFWVINVFCAKQNVFAASAQWNFKDLDIKNWAFKPREKF